ncbi:MAG TPA: hypothetical protein VFA46_10120 [Actinomycetes bacterium]|jgi:hypothetical protein|nr:hypothetical protein [Actinomycetes bacterium]
MKLQLIAGECRDGTCPAVYRADNGNLVIQGRLVDHSDVGTSGVVLGDDEALVEVPAELVEQINA